MIIGVPKEIVELEYRVALVPADVKTLVAAGAEVWIGESAGVGAGYSDAEYMEAGALIRSNAEIYAGADMLLKLKVIQPQEYAAVRGNQIVSGYIQGHRRVDLMEFLASKAMQVIAYERMEDASGDRPMMLPMSQIAGHLGAQLGFYHLLKPYGGPGILSGMVPGATGTKVLIFGAGGSGEYAAKLAKGNGADVIVMARTDRQFSKFSGTGIRTEIYSRERVQELLSEIDLFINCVRYSPGLQIISRPMLQQMKSSALIVDVDAEPQGAIETSRHVSFHEPIYVVDGIRHMTVENLPSAAPREASNCFSRALLPFVLEIIELGLEPALLQNPVLQSGTTIFK